MFCTKCGAPLPEDARFCTSCGTPVVSAETEVSAAASSEDDLPVVVQESSKDIAKPAGNIFTRFWNSPKFGWAAQQYLHLGRFYCCHGLARAADGIVDCRLDPDCSRWFGNWQLVEVEKTQKLYGLPQLWQNGKSGHGVLP